MSSPETNFDNSKERDRARERAERVVDTLEKVLSERNLAEEFSVVLKDQELIIQRGKKSHHVMWNITPEKQMLEWGKEAIETLSKE